MANKTWYNCIEVTAQDLGIELTQEQIECFADACEAEHENWDMYSYSPGPSVFVEIAKRDHKREMDIVKDQADVEIQRLREQVQNLRYENERLSNRIYQLQREGRP